jgi:hypothetical protein
MRDLAEAGRAVVANPPAPPTPIDRIEATARHRRRRHVRATLAFATALTVIAGALVIANDRKSTPPVGSVRPTNPPKHAPALTPQMRAHLGIDAPKGWVPVDYGDARLWVPPTWAVTAGSCPPVSAPGWIQLGGPYRQLCPVYHGTIGAPRQDYVNVTTLRDTNTVGTIKRVINTYAVYDRITHGPGGDYAVPALHVTIALGWRTPQNSRVLQTLGPSARLIALDPSAQKAPNGWQHVEYGGLTIAAPSTWPAQDVAGRIGPGCELLGHERVWAGPPSLTAQCALTLTPPRPTDGVWLDHTPITGAGIQQGEVLHGNWGNRVEIRLLTDPSYATIPELRMEVTVDEYTSELDIGLGRDGRIAKAILQSISASPGAGSGFVVAGCPPQPPNIETPVPAPSKIVVPGQPVSALACVYDLSGGQGEHLVAATQLDAGSTTRAVNAPERTGCLFSRSAVRALVLFGYRDTRTEVVVEMNECLTQSRSGEIRTPPALWTTLVNLATGS